MNRDFDMEVILSQVSCPALVLVGEEELGGIIPAAETERVRQILPDGPVKATDDMGPTLHRSNLNRFVELTRSFLGQ